jgi:hypothetical protein
MMGTRLAFPADLLPQLDAVAPRHQDVQQKQAEYSPGPQRLLQGVRAAEGAEAAVQLRVHLQVFPDLRAQELQVRLVVVAYRDPVHSLCSFRAPAANRGRRDPREKGVSPGRLFIFIHSILASAAGECKSPAGNTAKIRRLAFLQVAGASAFRGLLLFFLSRGCFSSGGKENYPIV